MNELTVAARGPPSAPIVVTTMIGAQTTDVFLRLIDDVIESEGHLRCE